MIHSYELQAACRNQVQLNIAIKQIEAKQVNCSIPIMVDLYKQRNRRLRVPSSIKCTVGQPPHTQIMYQLCYLWNNNIGSEGCSHLSKTGWSNLHTIDLGNNRISDQGCKYLSKTKWNNLHTIILHINDIGAEGCNHLSKTEWKNLHILHQHIISDIKIVIKSGIMGVKIYRRLSGKTCKNSTYGKTISKLKDANISQKLSGLTSKYFTQRKITSEIRDANIQHKPSGQQSTHSTQASNALLRLKSYQFLRMQISIKNSIDQPPKTPSTEKQHRS